MKINILICVLLLCTITSTAAQTQRSQPTDSTSLRENFLAAFGRDFDLVRDEFKAHPSGPAQGSFWLAHVRAKHTGHFSFQYRFKPKGQHYSHVERQISFAVAPKGCRRGTPSFGVYRRFCLGDTIVIPVVVEASTNNHQFKLIETGSAGLEDWKIFDEKYPEAREQGLDKTPVDNPSQHLRYVGRTAHKAFHRSPGYTLSLEAQFEAVKPGRLNLQVGPSAYPEASDQTSSRSLPIVVVERDRPVTLIAGQEQITGFSLGANGEEYASSSSGHTYSTTLIILQPGDRISVYYFSIRRDRMFERRGYGREGADPAEVVKPVISVYPFAHDPTYDYGGWLADYLPVFGVR